MRRLISDLICFAIINYIDVDAEHANSVQLGASDEDDEVMYDDGSDEFEIESDDYEYESVLHKPWAALDEEEKDAALNLGAIITPIQRLAWMLPF